MRLLNRNAVQIPPCLLQYQHGRHDWSTLATNLTHYREVCDALIQVQGDRCAYCDCDLSKESAHPHVEHFFQRNRFPERTFLWANLFRSCTHHDRCGKLKDTSIGSYSDDDLVKPDVTDPHHLLHFSSDGRVRARPEISSRDTWCANETIRVFGLDCRGLRGTRRQYIAPVLSELEQAQAAGFSDAELSQYRQLIADDYADHPFQNAVLDTLGL